MAQQFLSCQIYQIDSTVLNPHQFTALVTADITRKGIFPTRSGTTKLDPNVNNSVYMFVNAGVQVLSGRIGYKNYYTNLTVQQILDQINS